MVTTDLTEEDVRVLQYIADRGQAGIATDRAVPRYRALAKAGLLEHRAVSLDAEWFGLSEQGREALGRAATAATLAGSKIEWRPIATAPRDLTMVRLRLENGVGPNREPIETTGYHIGGGAWVESPNRGVMLPTHWAPLED